MSSSVVPLIHIPCETRGQERALVLLTLQGAHREALARTAAEVNELFAPLYMAVHTLQLMGCEAQIVGRVWTGKSEGNKAIIWALETPLGQVFNSAGTMEGWSAILSSPKEVRHPQAIMAPLSQWEEMDPSVTRKLRPGPMFDHHHLPPRLNRIVSDVQAQLIEQGTLPGSLSAAPSAPRL